jgi:hypothetical protein
MIRANGSASRRLLLDDNLAVSARDTCNGQHFLLKGDIR